MRSRPLTRVRTRGMSGARRPRFRAVTTCRQTCGIPRTAAVPACLVVGCTPLRIRRVRKMHSQRLLHPIGRGVALQNHSDPHDNSHSFSSAVAPSSDMSRVPRPKHRIATESMPPTSQLLNLSKHTPPCCPCSGSVPPSDAARRRGLQATSTCLRPPPTSSFSGRPSQKHPLSSRRSTRATHIWTLPSASTRTQTSTPTCSACSQSTRARSPPAARQSPMMPEPMTFESMSPLKHCAVKAVQGTRVQKAAGARLLARFSAKGSLSLHSSTGARDCRIALMRRPCGPTHACSSTDHREAWLLLCLLWLLLHCGEQASGKCL